MAANDQGTAKARNESSTIFSITELMRMEEVRLDEERKHRQRSMSQAEAARRAAQERERQEMEERKREEEARHRARQEREAEEAAMLAGRMLAFVSRTKVEAETEATLRIQRETHQRELELTRARNDTRLFQWRAGLVAVAATALLGLGAMTGSYFGVIQPDHESAMARLQSEKADQATKIAKLERDVDQEVKRRHDLEERGVALNGRLAATEQEVAALKDDLASVGRTGRPRVPTTTKPPEVVTPVERCPLGDPMCVEKNP